MTRLPGGVPLFAAIIVGMCCGPLSGDDWPAYRHDPRGSGVSMDDIALPLVEVWAHRSAPPAVAWPELPAVRDVYHRVERLLPTTDFDRAFQLSVAGGAVLYGSSSDDTVRCLDGAEGSVRWTFTADGPVRIAPAVADGRVYVCSDDGWVYCLRQGDGGLIWKYRGGPEERRLPGNGRMISLWPVRCGIVVDGGVAYFCAGLFPEHGAWLCAVSADSGKEVWKQSIGVVAQGNLLAAGAHLYVPTGRTAPVAFERATGARVASLPGAGPNRLAGGCFAAIVDDLIMYSAGESGGIHSGSPVSKEKLLFAEGIRMAADKTMAYVLTRDRVMGVDRAHWIELSRLQSKIKKTPDDLGRIASLGGTRKDYIKWDAAVPDGCEVILAGRTLFVGEQDRVSAYDAADGRMVWRGNVQGKAHGLAVADGRLYASTDRGVIHCFQPGKPPPPGPLTFEFIEDSVKESPFPGDELSPLYEKAADSAIAAADTKKGYCLVLGSLRGRLAYEIARRSELQVIGIERDAGRVAESRRLLAAAGVYGGRVTIHQVEGPGLPFQRYWANLIVSEAALTGGEIPCTAAEAWRSLRPCGGAISFVTPDTGKSEDLATWGKGTVPGWEVKRTEGVVTCFARRGSLPGAGAWTHFYGDAGNTACSGDAMAPGPVDIQWFGRPGPNRIPDRHDKSVAPLYTNGRLFVSGDNRISAVDAYNGTILWERDVPDSVRLAAFKNCGSMAASDDSLWMASGAECFEFDAQTGDTRRIFNAPTAPDGSRAEWGYVAVTDGILVGSAVRKGGTFREQTIRTEVLLWRDHMPVVCSDSIFGHDRGSGRRLWTYEAGAGAIINPTIAAGGDSVFFIESLNPASRAVADGRVRLSTLVGKGADVVAIDLRTGAVKWRKPARLEAIEHVIYLSHAKNKVLITGTRNAMVDGLRRVRYDLAAHDATSGDLVWKNTQVPTPDHILQGPHGEQVQHPAIVGGVVYGPGFACALETGAAADVWRWQKSSYCGTISTSENCAFSRYNNPRMFDLKSGEHTVLSTAIRPGCWINIIPAGGLILVPESSAGCTCGHPIQTTMAFLPR